MRTIPHVPTLLLRLLAAGAAAFLAACGADDHGDHHDGDHHAMTDEHHHDGDHHAMADDHHLDGEHHDGMMEHAGTRETMMGAADAEHHMSTENAHAHDGDHGDQSSLMSKADAAMPARTVTITATDYQFEPKRLTARPGETLQIELVNEGSELHMWQLEDRPDTHVHAEPGATATARVTVPDQLGTYRILCPTKDHADKGMTGTLLIAAPN